MVIVGGGFAGLKAAKGLANTNDIDVTLLDGLNHHLFFSPCFIRSRPPD